MKIQEAIWTQYAEIGKTALASKQLTLAEQMFTAAAEEAQRGAIDQGRLADSWFGLAQTHHMRRQIVMAAYYYKKAQQLYERSKEKFASQLAATFDNLAELAMAEGDFAKAYTMLRRSVVIYEKLFGSDSEVLAPRLMRIGFIHSQSKEFDRALACYTRAKALAKPRM
jgi:tetratricopeptide (TPR) repeat protein